MAENSNRRFALQEENEFQQLSRKCYRKIEILQKHGLNITDLEEYSPLPVSTLLRASKN